VIQDKSKTLFGKWICIGYMECSLLVHFEHNVATVNGCVAVNQLCGTPGRWLAGRGGWVEEVRLFLLLYSEAVFLNSCTLCSGE
jgi:hypothetical protein